MKTLSLPKRPFALPLITVMILSAALALTACSPETSPDTDQDDVDAQATSLSSKQLVADDMAAFSSQADLSLAIPKSQPVYQAFQSVFSGFTGSDIRSYMDLRIHNFFSEYDVDKSKTEAADQLTTGGSGRADESAKAVIGAANIGAVAWFQALYANRPLKVTIAGQMIMPTSSRVGIMMIGPGYDRIEQRADGSIYRFPREYRQSILIHEARHSDCTGGITQSAIDTARASGDFGDFLQQTQASDCAHLHTICPSWHSLHGLAGCDDKPWGAYAVQATYAHAMFFKAKAENDYVTARVMEISALDAAERLLYVMDDGDINHIAYISRLWNGDFGPPDMSSAGVINK